jgi:hypothetical protein
MMPFYANHSWSSTNGVSFLYTSYRRAARASVGVTNRPHTSSGMPSADRPPPIKLPLSANRTPSGLSNNGVPTSAAGRKEEKDALPPSRSGMIMSERQGEQHTGPSPTKKGFKGSMLRTLNEKEENLRHQVIIFTDGMCLMQSKCADICMLAGVRCLCACMFVCVRMFVCFFVHVCVHVCMYTRTHERPYT